MMELRFGILNMQLPVVAVIVGTGSQWKESEVSMLFICFSYVFLLRCVLHNGL